MVNLAILDQAVTYIQDHPEEHNQKSWTCDTGACLAGHIALLNGYEKALHPTGYFKGMVNNGRVTDSTGLDHDVAIVAMHLLEMTEGEVFRLFHQNNSAENIALMAKDLANGDSLVQLWSNGTDADGKDVLVRVGDSNA